jgi:hypothetical protein
LSLNYARTHYEFHSILKCWGIVKRDFSFERPSPSIDSTKEVIINNRANVGGEAEGENINDFPIFLFSSFFIPHRKEKNFSWQRF